jgi:hypothetical protein
MLALNPEKRISIQRVVTVTSNPDKFETYISKLETDNDALQRHVTVVQSLNSQMKLSLSKAESERDSSFDEKAQKSDQLDLTKKQLAQSQILVKSCRDDFLHSEHGRLIADARVNALTDKLADAHSERETAISERNRIDRAQTANELLLCEKAKRICDLESSLRRKDEELSQQNVELLALRKALAISASLAVSNVYNFV